jgi:hypothetical protein
MVIPEDRVRKAIESLLALLRNKSMTKDRGAIRGHLVVQRANGEIMFESDNLIVDAGLEALVDSFVTGTPALNAFKYVGFGTSAAASTADMTALTAEVSGGTYARLTGDQAEGTTKQYVVSGSWTNNSAASQLINEYGLFNAATDGTMFARVSTVDASAPEEKSVGVGDSITLTWTFTWSDGSA